VHTSQQTDIENLSNIKADLYNDISSEGKARGKVFWIATWTRPMQASPWDDLVR
jgi:hypothetical protein